MSRILIRSSKSIAYARPNRELMYSEDELLMLSGMQHIAFCERQWALIHIEQQWAENVLTIEGQFLHERVNDPFEDESRNDIMTWRSLYLTSYRLGLYGRSDVVELVRVTGNVTDTISIDKNTAGGNWYLWNTKGESQNLMNVMKSSYVPRQCVWKKCSM